MMPKASKRTLDMCDNTVTHSRCSPPQHYKSFVLFGSACSAGCFPFFNSLFTGTIWVCYSLAETWLSWHDMAKSFISLHWQYWSIWWNLESGKLEKWKVTHLGAVVWPLKSSVSRQKKIQAVLGDVLCWSKEQLSLHADFNGFFKKKNNRSLWLSRMMPNQQLVAGSWWWRRKT